MEVRGKLLVVKGDGTPVDESVAMERPVETILSGPGRQRQRCEGPHRTGRRTVVDLGERQPTAPSSRTATRRLLRTEQGGGAYVSSVDAVEITTIAWVATAGIGFDRARAITIGPGRCIPLCSLAPEHAVRPGSPWQSEHSECRRIRGCLRAGRPGSLNGAKAQSRLPGVRACLAAARRAVARCPGSRGSGAGCSHASAAVKARGGGNGQAFGSDADRSASRHRRVPPLGQ